MTVRAKVADPALVAGLQEMLLRPQTVETIAAAVATEVSRLLADQPAQRKELRQAIADRSGS